MNLRDTIVALSTPAGRSGLAVLRISGPQARAITSAILRLAGPAEWPSWTVRLGTLIDENGVTVDQVVATFFEAPRSYTAEDVVEISCHGAPVIVRFCLERALAAGARLAEPGEFTLRAFLNGRIDLPQAEAVRDLIDATTLYQARVAARQIEGSVSKRLSPIKHQLLELIALLEAGIDFAEDDISVAPDHELLRRLEPIRRDIAALAASFAYGQCVRSGLTLAIVGRPNVGKSSLFNRLLEQDRAIVTEIPGTTRDLISESASIEGIPVRLVDTAGIRTGESLVENLGIERSFQAMADADVTLVVVDLSAPLSTEDPAILDRARGQGRFLLVGNKADLPRQAEPLEGLLAVSAQTGAGIDSLRRAILPVHEDTESVFVTSLRQERLLTEALQALDHAAVAIGERIPHEMLLLDLYAALAPVDAITGATTADDILNRIFSTFCIGK